MKSIKFFINLILVIILIYLTVYKNKYHSKNEILIILIILLVLLFSFCSYRTIENFDNINEDDETYDIEDFETNNLKVVKKLNGEIINQIIKEFPVGYIYLTTKKDFDPNNVFIGKWESLAKTENNLFIMTANDGDNIDYNINNKRNCAYRKKIDNICPEQTNYDLIPNIKSDTIFGEKVREYGSEYKTRLTIDNIPPHTQFLRGGKAGGDDPSNCYRQSKYGLCIDYNNIVGNATTTNSKDKLYKRINNNNVDSATTIKEMNTLVNERNKNYQIPKDENKFMNQIGDKVAEHINQPPYINVYAWRKISD